METIGKCVYITLDNEFIKNEIVQAYQKRKIVQD